MRTGRWVDLVVVDADEVVAVLSQIANGRSNFEHAWSPDELPQLSEDPRTDDLSSPHAFYDAAADNVGLQKSVAPLVPFLTHNREDIVRQLHWRTSLYCRSEAYSLLSVCPGPFEYRKRRPDRSDRPSSSRRPWPSRSANRSLRRRTRPPILPPRRVPIRRRRG